MTRWKRQEREIAKALGGRRNPNTGEWRSDINVPGFAVEVKTRRTLPAWLVAAVAQSVRAAEEDETPIVVLSAVSQGRKADRYVVMRFQDFEDWYGA
jgi:hypothetical protein